MNRLARALVPAFLAILAGCGGDSGSPCSAVDVAGLDVASDPAVPVEVVPDAASPDADRDLADAKESLEETGPEVVEEVAPEVLEEVLPDVVPDDAPVAEVCVAGDPCLVTGAAGACPGVVQCTDAGSVCVGRTPTAETWNGIDDNCDGVADNGVPVLMTEVAGEARYVSVAADPSSGRAFVAWAEGTWQFGWGQEMHISSLLPGLAPTVLAKFDANVFFWQAEAALQVVPDGTLQVVWHIQGSFDEEMAHVALPPYAPTGPAERFTDQPQINCDFPHLRVDKGGALHTIFAAEPDGAGISNLFYIKLAYDAVTGKVSPLLGGQVGLPVTAAKTTSPERHSDLALDGDGNPCIVVRDNGALLYVRLDGATGEVKNGPVTLTASGFDSHPMLWMAPDGDLRFVVLQDTVVMYGRVAPDGTVVEAAAPVSPSGADNPGVLVTSDGRVNVFWQQKASGGGIEVYRLRGLPGGGAPSGTAVPVTPDDGVDSTYTFPYTALTVDPMDTLHLVWEEHPAGGGSRIFYERLAP